MHKIPWVLSEINSCGVANGIFNAVAREIEGFQKAQIIRLQLEARIKVRDGLLWTLPISQNRQLRRYQSNVGAFDISF